MSSLGKLLNIASSQGSPIPAGAVERDLLQLGRIGGELAEFLLEYNGFYAFESSLHLFGFAEKSGSVSGQDLISWNRLDGWRESYGSLASDCLFFAEDVFGNQFAIEADGESVASFDAETAERELIASSLEEWSSLVLEDADFQTGFPLAHEWQTLNGSLVPGFRLLPKVPFVLGGAYSVENLYDLRAEEGMRFRGNMARQIANAQDGTSINIEPME